MQSTGQGFALQGLGSVKLPMQGFPPLLAITEKTRFLCEVPPPQLTEQLDHCCHNAKAQLTAQGPLLHFPISTVPPWQLLPPNASTTFFKRLRCFWPPPHHTVHQDHELHEPH